MIGQLTSKSEALFTRSVINFSFFISVKMCSVSPVDELRALGQTLVKINMFIQK